MKAQALIVALLACLAIVLAESRFQPASGIDFYQYWAVQAALESSEESLEHPYRDQAEYAQLVHAIAKESQDAALTKVDAYRAKLDLTGTPFLYTLLGFLLPRDYSLAYTLFQLVQYGCFLGAIGLLGWRFRVKRFEAGVLALLLLCVYDPFASDLRVGNTNALQLAAVVALVGFAHRLPTRSMPGLGWISTGFYLAGLCGLTLFKPNLLPVTLLLAGHVVVRQGIRSLAPIALATIASSLLIILASCWYFGSFAVWGDWYGYVYQGSPGKFSGTGWKAGNFGIVFLLGGRAGIGTTLAISSMGALLSASLLAALAAARRKDLGLANGICQAAMRALGDPYWAGSAGVLALLALSPLIWQHYYALSLLPALWLLWGSHRWAAAGWMGALSIALTSGIYFGLAEVLNREVVVHSIHAASWIPLWLGLLAAVGHDGETAVQPTQDMGQEIGQEMRS